MQSAVRTHSDSGFSESETNFSSSPDSPYETPPPLSAAVYLSLSAGVSSASPSSLSVEEIMLKNVTLHTMHH